MDVVFLGLLRGPRGIVLDVYHRGKDGWNYTVISQGEGHHYTHECYCMDKEQWKEWATRFQDELTGKDFREIMAAVDESFEEPEFWRGFRERYAATGDPWTHPENTMTHQEPSSEPESPAKKESSGDRRLSSCSRSSDTPETDDYLLKHTAIRLDSPLGEKMRELERDRNEARMIAEQAVAGIDRLCSHIRPELPKTPLPWNSPENEKSPSTGATE